MVHPALSDPAVQAEADELDAIEAANPVSAFMVNRPGVGEWGAAPWQKAILHDETPQISIIGGNKVGKSTELALIVWSFLLGLHPVHRPPKGRPAVVLYMSADLENAYADDVCRSLHDFHTAAIIKPGCVYSPEKGYFYGGRRMLATTTGRVIFRSGLQDPQAIAGIWADIVVVNELPTSRHWGELMRATATTMAPVYVGFTALPPESVRHNDDLGWYWDEIDDKAKGWKEYIVPLRPETTPHRSEENRQLQISRCKPWERAQRIDAARYGPAPDRRLANFDDARCVFGGDSLLELPGLRTGEQIRIRIGGDHGELTGREAWGVAAYVDRPQDPRAWLLDCYVSPGRTTVHQDAAAVASMLDRLGLSLHHVDSAVGDINTAGKSSEFVKVNDEFEAAFAELAGTARPPFRIDSAEKGPGSVAYGVHVLDESFGGDEPALMVHERARPFISAARRWNGKHDKHSHLIDFARYLFVPVLEKRWQSRLALPSPTSAAPSPWTQIGVPDPAGWDGGAWDGSG